ncbi:MAG: PLP-dependent aminotransferase family protein, partial [Dehalococcoidia bacterium]
EPYVSFRRPAGGFYFWLRLAPGVAAHAVFEASARRGVAVTPGTGYYAHGGGEDHIRLVFSAFPPEELRTAIARFAEALAEVASAGTPSARGG